MRNFGDGLFGECLFGGTDLAGCTMVLTSVPCPRIVPEASSPSDRVLVDICPEGDCS